MPTPPLAEALVRAGRRGVNVQLILPPASHPFFVGFATEHRLGRLLEAGLKVWHWNGAMMHAKTVVVDRCWSFIGSTNLDWLSLRRNAEMNTEVHGSRVGEQRVITCALVIRPRHSSAAMRNVEIGKQVSAPSHGNPSETETCESPTLARFR